MKNRENIFIFIDISFNILYTKNIPVCAIELLKYINRDINMNKELKDYFFLMESGFRRMTKKKRGLDILQFFADFYIGSECILTLSSSFSFLPFTLLLVLLAKIILHLFRRDSLGNYIGLCLNTLFIIMGLSFKLGFFATPIVAYIVHFLRIKSCFIDSKLKRIYGYPSFNPLYLENELASNVMMAESVKADYDEVSESFFIKLSAAESRCSSKIQILKLAGLILMCIGIGTLGFGMKQSLAYQNAVSVVSLDDCTVGSKISGTVYELYDNCCTGLSDNVTDGYWGVFGGRLIMFDVPYSYKNSFASLYNIYADQYELTGSIGQGGGDDADPQSGIEFHGELLSIDKYEFPVRQPDTNSLPLDLPEADNTCFIRIIDEKKADSAENRGIIFITIGAVSIAVSMVCILRKLDDYDDKLIQI